MKESDHTAYLFLPGGLGTMVGGWCVGAWVVASCVQGGAWGAWRPAHSLNPSWEKGVERRIRFPHQLA